MKLIRPWQRRPTGTCEAEACPARATRHVMAPGKSMAACGHHAEMASSRWTDLYGSAGHLPLRQTWRQWFWSLRPVRRIEERLSSS